MLCCKNPGRQALDRPGRIIVPDIDKHAAKNPAHSPAGGITATDSTGGETERLRSRRRLQLWGFRYHPHGLSLVYSVICLVSR